MKTPRGWKATTIERLYKGCDLAVSAYSARDFEWSCYRRRIESTAYGKARSAASAIQKAMRAAERAARKGKR